MQAIRAFWVIMTLVMLSPLTMPYDMLLPKGSTPEELVRWFTSLLEWSHLSDEDRYQLAARYYEAEDLEKSLVLCTRILRANPYHAPTRALYKELFFAHSRPAWPQHQVQLCSTPRIVDQQLAIIDSDKAWERGCRECFRGHYVEADREIRQSLILLNRCAVSIEVKMRFDRAREGLAKTRALQSGQE